MHLSEEAPTIERVLCALDVEQPVLGAVSLAGQIATRFGVALEVLHVESEGGAGPFHSNADRVQELMASHNAGQLLDQLVAGRGHPETTTTRLVSGKTVASILEGTAVSGNDLLVLGARQRSDLGWQFRDDIARQVSALAPCPTLTVHEGEGRDRIERILVPVDLGPGSARAVAWAGAFARRFAAEVHVLHVASRESKDVTARIASLTAELARSGLAVTNNVAISGSVVDGITECNERGGFGLLVVGLSGPPQGAPRLTRGVAATLRSRLSIPLLSFRQRVVDSPHSVSGTGTR